MRHRPVLAAGALLLLALLAGCSAAGSLRMDPVDDAELAERASVDVPDERRDGVLRRALENGTATATDTNPPVELDRPVRYDGQYYEVDRRVVDRRPATAVDVGIDYNASDTSGRAVDYESLPPVDRRLLDSLLPPRHDRRVEGYDVGAVTVVDDEELAASVLAPDQQYDVVVYEGTRYPVNVADTREVTLKRYRYTAERIAESDAAYAADLRERYEFTLRVDAEAERSVVEEAANGSYYAEDTDDEAFRSVLERFRRHEAVTADEYGGHWVVTYRGRLYWASLRYGEFVTEDARRSASARETTAAQNVRSSGSS